MAEDKKSFVLYSDQRSIIEMLPDDKAGILLKHIFAYVNDENPINNDPLIMLAFEPIKLQFKRDLIKWLATKEGRSTAGKASAEARRLLKESQQSSTNLTNVDFVQQESTNPTVNVTVNDTVTVNVINKIDYQALLETLNLSFGRSFQVINKKVRASYEARLKEGYTKDQIRDAINNCKINDYLKEQNYQYCTPEFFSRAETLDKYSNVTKKDKVIYASHNRIID
jgi:uncharacterized phage protein (TIGR02220 family)